MKQTVVIADYGMGNVGSIRNMLKHIGVDALISGRPEDIRGADKLILSGVGAFDSGMRSIAAAGLLEVLNRKVMGEKTAILGICLGMQLFCHASEEGAGPGLGWLDAVTVKFSFPAASPPLRVPHMGWNTVDLNGPHPLFRDMPEDGRFYFVHSYHVLCRDEADIVGRTRYGYDFPSVVARDNLCGVQFHPEKSHRFGMTLLSNFIHL